MPFPVYFYRYSHSFPDQLEDAPVDYQTGSTDRNTVIFKLVAECFDNPNPVPLPPGKQPGVNEPERVYIGSNVFSGDMKWEPAGEQASMFGDDPPRPVNGNILLAKLRPGQVSMLGLSILKKGFNKSSG